MKNYVILLAGGVGKRMGSAVPKQFLEVEGKPIIGILAEYDALPGLSQAAVPYRQPVVEEGYGHGCGHNLLGTGSLAAGIPGNR